MNYKVLESEMRKESRFHLVDALIALSGAGFEHRQLGSDRQAHITGDRRRHGRQSRRAILVTLKSTRSTRAAAAAVVVVDVHSRQLQVLLRVCQLHSDRQYTG